MARSVRLCCDYVKHTRRCGQLGVTDLAKEGFRV